MRKSLLQIRILLLIILITVINYFDRNAISYAILPIQSDLGINSAQFGIIAASWAVGYLVAFFEGFLIDRFGSVKVWLISAILWSLLTMMISQVNTFFIFCLLRFFL
jgi:sugar phosphate permease